MKTILLLGMLTILLFSSTNAFAVVGHPTLNKPTLSKQEKRKLKRQQKLFNWIEEIQRKKLGKKRNAISSSTDCDTIVLNNGDRIAAMIFEIDSRRIQYIRCNQVGNRKVRILRLLVKEIRCQNGTTHSFVKPKAKESIAKPPVIEVITINATPAEIKEAKGTGILMGVLLGLSSIVGSLAILTSNPILGIFGIVGLLGLSALLIMNRKKEKFIRRTISNSLFSTFAIIITAAAVCLLILFIALLMSFSGGWW